ncbi:MAG: aldo/keto reductase [Alphaproteobacteria bacterium]|nr:aldo/keto reductase [Alphaproteobacteria bacterium]
MGNTAPNLTRRALLAALGAHGLILGPGVITGGSRVLAAANPILKRPIPTSGQRIPVIGMGSWITFNVGDDVSLRDQRVKVLQAFFDRGGGLIDSSPMYGSSEEVIGYCLKRITNKNALFSATKVWTLSRWMGVRQMNDSFKLWGVNQFDLMQIHNLLDWETHLETLKEWRAQGRVRYIGITTSHGSRHEELARIMASEPIDFVQFTYNVLDREAERRLLPLAAERGLAVIVNRPFRRGALFGRFEGHPLPAWAGEFDCANWAQFFLKFIVSHPAVTCAIPATSRVDHMQENMGAAYGPLPDAHMRKRMIQYVDSL